MNFSQSMKSEIGHTASNLWHFVKRPHISFEKLPFDRLWITAFATIIFVDIIFYETVLRAFFHLIETNGYQPPTEIKFNPSDRKEWIGLLFWAPIIEELAFRGWMNGRKRNLIAFITFLPVLLYEYTTLPMGSESIFRVLFGVSIFCIPAWWLFQSRKPQPVPKWFNSNFRLILYGSAIAFGLIHIFNYSDFEWGPDLLYVLPQIIGGLIMAYTRLRFGLFAAILHHAIFNAYFIATEIASAG
jgi:membrane protease YdiL (CAAX protease family)